MRAAAAVTPSLRRSAGEIVRRIWARDPALWRDETAQRREIAARLGWLDVPAALRPAAAELVWFARAARRDGFTHALLLGMGGSSLAPEVMRRVLGPGPDGLDLAVLDSTDPAQIRAAEGRADPARTLVIVSSKSGSTLEVDSLLHRARAARPDGRRFVAITDPGTALDRLASVEGFRRIFRNPPDIGGRYSALSYFGLVPAALLDAYPGRLLYAAADAARRCAAYAPLDGNPGLALGAFMGVAALAGRNKLTLVLDPRLEALGLWVEQLLAESTGKEGKGLVPVAGETLGSPAVYGPDRAFVSVALGHEPDGVAAHLRALERAGHPVHRMRLARPHDLGAQFFIWEFATAVAGALLGINPFDQPDVQEAKDRTRGILRAAEAAGRVPEPPPGDVAAELTALLRGLVGGRDYLALLAFAPFDPRYDAPLDALRAALRERFQVPVTVGFGPRYLHSTGQLHKGGPAEGSFIVLTCEHADDPNVPEAWYSFGTLERAQALGDAAALLARRRPVVRLSLADPSPERFAAACDKIREAAGRVT